MANIKISELNELYGAQKDYGDYVPIVDSSANETKKISVQNLIPSNIELIAVTDTEPIEYETGDKYYNTTNNRIYTATSSGWVSPQEPIKGILYIILEEQKSYTYDGTTLISVGGGGGGGIAVYPDEPEEDTKLYIEEEDLDGQYLPVDEDIYSTTETKTNKIWIDGKDIYRKVINTGAMTSEPDHNISNLDWLVNAWGTAKTNDGNFLPISFANSAGLIYQLSVYATSTKVKINKGSGITITNSYVTLEYTKSS